MLGSLPFFPSYVSVSCQVVDLELLSIAIRVSSPLANRSIASILVKLFSIWSVMSKYILAARNVELS
jgi:hypothetical protein